MASIIPTKDGDILKTGSSTMIDESLEKNPLTDLPAGASVVSDISPTPPKKEITYLKGWRLHMLTIAIYLCVLLVNMEVSIVSTSLVSITDDFHGFGQTSWLITAYLSTYTGFLIVWSKLGDIYAHRWLYMIVVFFFVAFSAACGAAQSMTQLIIFRAFQGIGGSGVFGVSLVIFYEMVPKSKYPFYGSLTSIVVAVATLSGPLVGGAIDNNTTWRWIFLLNVPGGAIIIVILMTVVPTSFPYHGMTDEALQSVESKGVSSLRKIDFLGAFLLLTASLLLVTSLLEVSTVFTWSSPATICLLVLSGVSWVGFFVWEWFTSQRNGIQQPMFPWPLMQNRVWMGLLLTSFLVGIPSTVITISIPQRAQAVNSDSPFQAGLRLLPYTVVVPAGTFLANMAAGKTKIPPIVFLLLGASLQIIGLALLLTIPIADLAPPPQYVYEVILALGVGISFGITLVANPHSVESQYIATASGAMMQFRMTGATIGLAIVTSALNGYLISQLSAILPESQVNDILRSVSTSSSFPSAMQDEIREAFGQGYSLQIKILLGFAAAQIPTVLMMWKRPQLKIH